MKPAPANRPLRWRRKTFPALALVLAFLPLSGAALDWKTGNGYRSAALAVPSEGRSGFALLPGSATGVQFTNHLSERTVAYNRVFENGSGVALGDVDGDGLCDIYFCQLEGPNALYRNRGRWKFEETAAASGVALADHYSSGATLADIDGDGDLDLLVTGIEAGTRAFLNDGKGSFTELTGTRLVRRFGSTSMALADIDEDGDLDLYVANYRSDTYKDRPPGLSVEAKVAGGKIVVTPSDRFISLTPREGGVEIFELGERDFLYLNDGEGRFSPVSWTSGAFLDEDGKPLKAAPMDWGLAVTMRDFNGDGAPDIYICNDFFHSLDQLWLNQGSQGFRAAPRSALRNMSLASMAVDVADINRDGFDDFFVADMLSRSHQSRQRQRPNMMKGVITPPVSNPEYRPEVARNTLFLNRGDGTYAEIAQFSGVDATEWSWGAVFLDVDLDGYEDLLIPNGNNRDVQDADAVQQITALRERETPEQRSRRFPRLDPPNLAFRNQGNLTFHEMGEEWGFNLQGVSQGMALADLDNDGDLDAVLNNLNAEAALYRNESPAPRLAVRLKGAQRNTRGIGAKIKVTSPSLPPQTQEMIAGGRYLSSDDPARVFAAAAQAPARIEVTWRSGARSVIEQAQPNTLYEIAEAGAAPPSAPAATSKPAPLFEDASRMLDHRHVDQPFDDFARQPLLTHQWSQLGPGAAWADLNGDGWDDLVIGAGNGGRLAWFQNDGQGGFVRRDAPQASGQDQTALVAWRNSPANAVILTGISAYESGGKSAVMQWAPESQTAPAIASFDGAAGPLAMSDVDGDGDLDLFAGARVLPGRFPESAPSRLYLNVDGAFQLDARNGAVLEKAGMVSGALFSDLDSDGDGDLVLACHWGPVRVFRNDGGALREATREMGLEPLTGWWNGVAAGDFDGDGRMDLAASNWGRNHKYQSVLHSQLHLHYRDYDGNGTVEALETFLNPESTQLVPWRDFDTVSAALPFVRGHISTYRAFGAASIQEICGDEWSKMSTLRTATLDSMIFLNRGPVFEAAPLPEEAQFAPAFGVTAADFNGDGSDDIFLAQNFFGVEPETSRYDGGRGLLLLNQPSSPSRFSPVSGAASGIEIYGEQRGSAAADYDRDGRVDLLVTQNSGATKLYRNSQGHPGLRVLLAGPAKNPAAVGATVRLKFGERFGPAREARAGGGYWSQDSFTLVMASPAPPDAVQVRWPNGKETTTPVSAGAKELRLSSPP